MKKKKMGKGLDALLDIYSAEDTKKPEERADNAEDSSDAKSGLSTLRISLIEPDRSQPRTLFDEEAIEELSQSVSQHGILQPILVRPVGDAYKIVAGERRWRAAMKAGLKEVPVIIREMTELEAMQIALIENLQRESLNPIEEALGYKRLLEEFSMTQEQIALRVSKPRSVIANSLRLLKLPDTVQGLLSQGDISVGHAKVLAGIDDAQRCEELAQRIKDEKLSVRELERIAAQKTETESVSKPQKAVSAKVNDPFLREIELSMSRVTAGKVKIAKAKNGKLRMDIEFKDMNDLREFASSLADITDTD